MMNKDILNTPIWIAVYQNPEYKFWISVQQVLPANEEAKRTEVRLSHIIELTFISRSNEEVIPEAIAVLDRKIQEAYIEAEGKVAQLNEIKSELLCITQESQ
jgi:hypothetical protein